MRDEMKKKIFQREQKKRLLVKGLSAILTGCVLLFGIVMARAYLRGEFQSVDSLQAYIGKYGVFSPLPAGLFRSIGLTAGGGAFWRQRILDG